MLSSSILNVVVVVVVVVIDIFNHILLIYSHLLY